DVLAVRARGLASAGDSLMTVRTDFGSPKVSGPKSGLHAPSRYQRKGLPCPYAPHLPAAPSSIPTRRDRGRGDPQQESHRRDTAAVGRLITYDLVHLEMERVASWLRCGLSATRGSGGASQHPARFPNTCGIYAPP